MVKGQDLASDAVLTGQSSDVTIYIYVGTVLGRQRPSWVSKNMSSEQNDGYIDKWFDNNHKQRDAQ
jgi:hypothetical protein